MMAGRISQIGWKSIEITLYACLLKALDAGRIQPVKFEIRPVELGGNPLRLTTKFDRFDQAGIQCNLSGFPPNSTGQIQPPLVKFNRALITGQIG